MKTLLTLIIFAISFAAFAQKETVLASVKGTDIIPQVAKAKEIVEGVPGFHEVEMSSFTKSAIQQTAKRKEEIKKAYEEQLQKEYADLDSRLMIAIQTDISHYNKAHPQDSVILLPNTETKVEGGKLLIAKPKKKE